MEALEELEKPEHQNNRSRKEQLEVVQKQADEKLEELWEEKEYD